MNNNKICFISCVNDEVLYSECIKYIENLYVPENFEMESIAITDAKSMASAYNEAMKKSDAKYKVYLHQDTFIINKNFLLDMLSIFECDEKIGLIGVVGAKTIPTNGIWHESIHKYGKVYESHTDKMELLAFKDIKKRYEEVKAIDGLIMVTQYDIPWREDIFDGWHFYDVSQSVEFSLAEYNVVVPDQYEPWCIHDCGLLETKNGYEEYRNLFLDEYSKDIFPLVSVLIPTHNRPEYFKIALESAVNQTYKNIEIIVCDDSDDEETKELIQPYLRKYKNIKYDFEKGLDGEENWRKCLKMSKGEYINYLMDDDFFHIEKISKMINYYMEYPNVSLVTSFRNVINKDGNIELSIGATKKLFKKDTIVSGKVIGNFILSNMLNVIGEPTTVLYKRKYYNKLYLSCNDDIVIYNADIVRSLIAFKDGDCVYISDALSCFRIHEGQEQNNNQIVKKATVEWYDIIIEYYKNSDFFNNKEEFVQSLVKWIQSVTAKFMFLRNSDTIYTNKLEDKLIKAIKTVLNNNDEVHSKFTENTLK